jgi:hypothetical protein
VGQSGFSGTQVSRQQYLCQGWGKVHERQKRRDSSAGLWLVDLTPVRGAGDGKGSGGQPRRAQSKGPLKKECRWARDTASFPTQDGW